MNNMFINKAINGEATEVRDGIANGYLTGLKTYNKLIIFSANFF